MFRRNSVSPLSSPTKKVTRPPFDKRSSSSSVDNQLSAPLTPTKVSVPGGVQVFPSPPPSVQALKEEDRLVRRRCSFSNSTGNLMDSKSVVFSPMQSFADFPVVGKDMELRKKRAESVCLTGSNVSARTSSKNQAPIKRSASEHFLHSWDFSPVFLLGASPSPVGDELQESPPNSGPILKQPFRKITNFEEEPEQKSEMVQEGEILYTTAGAGSMKVIFAGTQSALINAALNPKDSSHDSEFLDAFVVTHSYFVDAGTLLDEITYRFFHLDELEDAPTQTNEAHGFLCYIEDDEKSKQKEKRQLQLINTLRRWLKYNGHILIREQHLKVVFERFLSDLIIGDGLLPKWRELLARALHERSEAVKEPPKGIDSLKKKLKEKRQFIDLHPLAVAQQLTLMESERFRRIPTSELLHKRFNDPSTAPKLHEAIAYFNRLAMWVSTEIVSTPNIRLRGSVLSRFIDLAQALRKLNNFNSLMSVMSSLQHSAITRLKATWKLITPKQLQIYEQLCDLASLPGNHAVYRAALQSSTLPVIPYQGLYLKDLTFIEEKPTFLDSGHVNFSKLTLISKIVTSVAQAQEVSYKDLHPDLEIQAFLEEINGVSDEAEIYRLSRTIEPRQTAGPVDPRFTPGMDNPPTHRKMEKEKDKESKKKRRGSEPSDKKKSVTSDDDVSPRDEQEHKRPHSKIREISAKLEEQIALNKQLEAKLVAYEAAQAPAGEINLLKKEVIDLKEELQKKDAEIREFKAKAPRPPGSSSPKASPKNATPPSRREAVELKGLKEKLSIESKMRFLIYEELKQIKKNLETAPGVPQCVSAAASLEKMMQFFPLDDKL